MFPCSYNLKYFASVCRNAVGFRIGTCFVISPYGPSRMRGTRLRRLKILVAA